jgi:anti-sigma regulatory factor (Ser/Thr protein kinase)
MNAMEHGNHYQADRPVALRVLACDAAVAVQIHDSGGDQPLPETPVPDLQAKLVGDQSPRGWGLFLIKSLVDEMHVSSGGGQHIIELIMNLGGENHANPTL